MKTYILAAALALLGVYQLLNGEIGVALGNLTAALGIAAVHCTAAAKLAQRLGVPIPDETTVRQNAMMGDPPLTFQGGSTKRLALLFAVGLWALGSAPAPLSAASPTAPVSAPGIPRTFCPCCCGCEGPCLCCAAPAKEVPPPIGKAEKAKPPTLPALDFRCQFGQIHQAGRELFIVGDNGWDASGKIRPDGKVELLWIRDGQPAPAVYEWRAGQLVGHWGWAHSTTIEAGELVGARCNETLYKVPDPPADGEIH